MIPVQIGRDWCIRNNRIKKRMNRKKKYAKSICISTQSVLFYMH